MKLATEEYFAEVQKRTNEDAQYRKLAKGENESFTMVMKAEPGKGVPEDVSGGYQLKDGEMTEAWLGIRDTTFTLAAPYGIWVDILRGHLNATKALSLRKLKVKGSFLKLLKGSKSTDRWVQVLQSIPTEFEGEYSKYDTTGS
ncbi:MAG: SCP2 sterol-binding domain-containing protein [Actinobacteria bacterium]|nr:SCP2 sterol-binding domain-containing protein [Actinomycetota bacterium]MBU4217883.1 SCP2 sterol-binding domain-containing protein [Actinomycetota bacterium]MBU4359741.1 SCP2 sterol-binding domain-containing protein [Actinomycetota bacterium]MCG2819436.1 SCP2 sterol-binding domain-containing protein [Actinomycetes bacterium]